MDLRTLTLFAAERCPDTVALKERDHQLTYAELWARASALAAAMESRGVRHGDPVAVGMRNTVDHVVTFLATQILGAVHVPFNFRFKVGAVAELVEDAGARMVIVDDPSLPEAVAAQGGARDVEWVCSVEGSTGLLLADLEEDGVGRQPSTTVGPDDVSVMLYTSGTTGRPKGVELTHRNALARGQTYVPSVGMLLDSGIRTLGAAPLYHTVGLHYVLCVSLYLGATYYPVQDLTGDALLDVTSQEELTFLFGSPTLFHGMVEAGEATSRRLPSATHVAFGSAPMPPAQLRKMGTLFPNALVSEVYGMTEISVPFVTRDAFAAETGALYVTADHRVRVVSPGGDPDDVVVAGEEGELIVDMANDGCFSGYRGQPEKTAERVRGGWFYTSDACRHDGRGGHFITGRLDDMFISGAENIQPAEIEQVLSGHPGIADIAVIGTPHERWGDVVTALIVPRDENLAEEDVERFCRSSSLADFKRPRRVLFVDQIERNPSGKVVRSTLTEKYRSAFAASSASVDNP